VKVNKFLWAISKAIAPMRRRVKKAIANARKRIAKTVESVKAKMSKPKPKKPMPPKPRRSTKEMNLRSHPGYEKAQRDYMSVPSRFSLDDFEIEEKMNRRQEAYEKLERMAARRRKSRSKPKGQKKSTVEVPTHTRRTKSGKTVQVSEYKRDAATAGKEQIFEYTKRVKSLPMPWEHGHE
jgi:hypothetical protein